MNRPGRSWLRITSSIGIILIVGLGTSLPVVRAHNTFNHGESMGTVSSESDDIDCCPEGPEECEEDAVGISGGGGGNTDAGVAVHTGRSKFSYRGAGSRCRGIPVQTVFTYQGGLGFNGRFGYDWNLNYSKKSGSNLDY
jgi:hypothetical protein